MKQVTGDMVENLTGSMLLKNGTFLEEEKFDFFPTAPKLYMYLALPTPKDNNNQSKYITGKVNLSHGELSTQLAHHRS